MPFPTVSTVVVTFNRPEVLAATLDAVASQDRPTDRLIVVDNGDPVVTRAMLRERFPAVELIVTGDNLGFGAGLAVGMRAAAEHDPDFYWLLDDDTAPSPRALGRCLAVAERIDRLGVVGLSGGVLRWGVPVRRRSKLQALDLPNGLDAYRCDFTLVDGALVSAQAVATVGYPREDFFMMMEDVEFTSRVKQAGLEVILLSEPLVKRGHLGSGGAGGPAPPWRGYYQSRNHLAIALDRRSPAELLGWVYRQARFATGTIRRSDRKFERLTLRARGTWDALRGKMDRTIEPRP